MMHLPATPATRSSTLARVVFALALVVTIGTVQGRDRADVDAAPVAPFERVGATALGNERSVFAQVVTSGNGTFHSVIRQDTGLAQQIIYRTSDDGGRSWQFRQAFAGSSGSGATKPIIAIDGDHVAIAFLGSHCITFDSCIPTPYLTISTDDGMTWSPVRMLSDVETTSIVVAQDGPRTWVAWDRLDRGPLQLRSTTDGGATFGVQAQFAGFSSPILTAGDGVVALASGSSVVLATGTQVGAPQTLPDRVGALTAADGRVHAALLGGVLTVSTVVAASPSATWGPPVKVSTGRPGHVTIDARPGLVAVAWNQYEVTPSSRRATGYVASSPDGGQTFRAPVAIGENPDGVALSAWVSVADTSATGPIARFDWSLPDRYIDGPDTDSLREPANATNDPGLDGILVDVIDLDVSLDACDSAATPGRTIEEYRWTVDGIELPDTACNIVTRMRDEVPYLVGLTITDSMGQTDSTAMTVAPDDLLIVSIGDSIASGEGSPHVDVSLDGNALLPGFPITDLLTFEQWQDDPCHRTAYAGPALAAGKIEDADPRTSVTFVQLSCSGAAIMDVPFVPGALPSGPDDAVTGGLLDEYEGVEPAAGSLRPSQLDQLDALRGSRPVDALFVSIGANDVKFSDVVKECLKPQSTTVPSCEQSSTATNLASRFADLPRRYAALADRLTTDGIDPSSVYLTEYFDVTENSYGRADLRCAAEGVELLSDWITTLDSVPQIQVTPYLGAALAYLSEHVADVSAGGLITDDEAAWAKQYVLVNLNAAVKTATITHGWNYVPGIAKAFARHGYCSDDSWVVGLADSVGTQLDPNGAFHPNRAGQAAYGAAIARSVAADALPTEHATDDVLTGDAGRGDVYVLVDDSRQLTAVALRDTGAGLLPIGARRMAAVVPGSSGDPAATPTSPIAAGGTAAVAVWNEGWEYWTWYQAYAAPVAIVENVSVREVGLVQAPSGASKAIGDRATLVSMLVDGELAASRELPVHLEVSDENGVVHSADETVRVVPGTNHLLVPAADPLTLEPGHTYTAAVTIGDPPGAGDSASSDNSGKSAPVTVSTGRGVSLTFVPTTTTNGESVSCAVAATEARRQSSLAGRAIPVTSIDTQLACNPPAPIEPSDAGVLRALLELDELAQLTAQDAVVGVVPAGWLQRASGEAVGITGYGLRGILVEASALDQVLAHEIAHTVGIDHTPTRVTTSGFDVTARTRKQGIDWMFWRAERDQWTGAATWDSLVGAIGGPERAPTLPDFQLGSVFVRGFTYQDATGAWQYRPGGWVSTSTGSGGGPGGDGDLDDLELERMTARQTDTDTGAVTEEPLGLTPIEPVLGSDGVESDLRTLGLGLTARVEVLPGTDVIELVLDGGVVETRTVSPSAPTVSVTSPVGGSYVARGGALEVTWSADDADGDALTFDLLISEDAGATWEPLAVGVVGTSYSTVAPADVDGQDVVVRVVASDGVRQGYGDSDVFTIAFVERGPQQIVYERLGRNVEGCGDTMTENCRLGLWTMAPDGTGDRQLLPYQFVLAGSTTSVSWPHAPALSPDGRSLAFQASWVDGVNFREVWDNDQHSIFVSDNDGSEPRMLLQPTHPPFATSNSQWLQFECPSWSPDGSRIAFRARYYGLGGVPEYVGTVANDGTDMRLVGMLPLQYYPYTEACPSWSPDGTEVMLALALKSSLTGDPAAPVPAPETLTPDNSRGLVTWSAANASPLPGAVLTTVPRPIDGATGLPIDGGRLTATAQLADGSILVGDDGYLACGILRISADGATQERVMNCPVRRIPLLPTDPPGTSRGIVQWYQPWGLHPVPTPDGRIAISTGVQFLRYLLDDYGGFVPSLCTAPGDVTAPALILADRFNDYVPPGHECIVGPGVTAPYPSTTSAFGGVHHTWSAGPVLDAGGSGGLVTIPDEPAPAPADAGGPYQGVAGEPIVLDAGASALAHGDPTATIEWDTDGDGAFDDAVGVRPTVAYENAGSFTVRVRITSGSAAPVVSEPVTAEIAAAPVVPVEVADDISDPAGPIPLPADRSVTIPAGATTTVQLQRTDGSPDRFRIVAGPEPDIALTSAEAAGGLLGAIVTGPDGAVDLTPATGFLGSASFTFRLDGTSGPDATVTVEVVGNAAPIARADTIEVDAGIVAIVDPAALLANDTDPDGESAPAARSLVASLAPAGGLQVVGAGGSTNGQVWLGLDGLIRVLAATPGTGEFTYTVADGGGSITDGLVRLDVRAAVVTTVTAPPATTTTTTTTAVPPATPSTTTTTTVTAPTVSTPTTTASPAGVLPGTGGGPGPAPVIAAALVIAGFVLLAARTGHLSRPKPR